jgi:UDP-N-acetylglucosamine--dolichyl-phosphate N-acetylglucosaminephosphotransferase
MAKTSLRYGFVALTFGAIAYEGLPLLTGSRQSFDITQALLYLASCIITYTITYYKVIPFLIPMNIKAGMHGKDIYLKGTPEFERLLPECLGLGIAVVYLCHIICMFGYAQLTGDSLIESWLTPFFAYVISGVFLGFVDDVLELRWRDKLIFPFFFSILLIVHYQGSTAVHLPPFLARVLPFSSIELGPLFAVYLICLSIFSVNSINIYAGISGLESGQSLIIGLTLMLENLVCMTKMINYRENFASLVLLGPFCAASLALLRWNRVEAKTFVGDTYCYFAGCVFAACAIIGKYPIKIMLFFAPQLFNFVISIPQLIGIVHCPRHRLPTIDLKTRRLTTTFPTNLNLVNFALWVTGPITEQQLGDLLIALQVVTNLSAVLLLRCFE